MLKLLICNSRKCDLENTNNNVKNFLNVFKNSQVYIFHDNDKIEEYNYYEKAKIITLNKNIGILMGRKELVKNLPEEENDDACIWLDSDDVLLVDNIQPYYDEFVKKNLDFCGDLKKVMVWGKMYKQSLLKKIYDNIPQNNYGLDSVIFEDSYAKKSLMYILDREKIVGEDKDVDIIKYSGSHPHYNIADKKCAINNFSSAILEYVWSLNKNTIFYNKNAKMQTVLFCSYCKRFGLEYVTGILKDLAKKCKEYKPYVDHEIAKIEKLYKISLD
jgi:hypothetical protein